MKNKKGFIFWGFIIVLFLFPSIFNVTNIKKENLKSEADDNNYKGSILLNKGDGNEKEAIEYFQLALDNISQYEELLDSSETDSSIDELKGDVYDNLSMAYYILEDYDLSLEYSEQALELMPDTPSEYVNYGNVLSSFQRNEEALESYDKAIDLNKKALYAYYGKGCIYYDWGEYEKALEMFEHYRKLDSEDMDGNLYYLYCLIYTGRNEDAMELTDELLIKNPDSYDLFKIKGKNLYTLEGYAEAEEFYQEMVQKFTESEDAGLLLGELYYNNSDYQKALDYFMELSESYPNSSEIGSWIIYCYEGLDDLDGAMNYCDEVLKSGTESSETFNAMGNFLIDKTMYMESVKYFEEAIQRNPEEEAYLNKLYSLYYGKRYQKCIDFGLESEDKFTTSYDIPWYIADSYFYLSDYENALTYYQKTLELNEDNATILAYIAYSYYMLEDYVNAKTFMEKSITIDSQNNTALTVEELLNRKKNPINEQIREFFQENYLYYSDEKNMDDMIKKLFSDAAMTNDDITIAVEDLKKKDDIFTFVIHDEEYDYYASGEADDIHYDTKNNIFYLRIDGFNLNTDNKVIELLDTIERPEDTTLVIDLRQNFGGLTDAANNILDALLPEVVTSTLIDREGYTYNYNSDASQLEFNNIYILVDEYTASAAELLTLGLKTYLNNVTVIGTETFGKGVGQYVFEDKERKLMVYVVNHYWNVRQENIMKEGISPDIYLKSNNIEDYMNIVMEEK